jgi:hypothetical protein
MARKMLGEILVEAGVIDEAMLRNALADQRRWGRTLGRTLVDLGFVAEETLVQVLGKQLGLASVDLSALNIPYAVISMVPAELARRHHLVPFAQRMKFLDVAMIDPTNVGVIDELRIRTQLNIHPYLAGPRQVDRALERYYGEIGLRLHETVIPFEQPDVLDFGPPPAAAAAAPSPRQLRQRSTDFGPGEPRAVPYVPPAPPSGPAPQARPMRDAEIDALQARISTLEGLVERDEAVLRKLLVLLIDKGIASRDEILERLS